MSTIPVYTVTVPSYALKELDGNCQTVEHFMTPWHRIQIPKVYEERKPDFAAIGAKIDRCLKRHFVGKHVAIRAISSREHNGKSVDEVITMVKKVGYDRYDPNRPGNGYENLEHKHIDFFALDFCISAERAYFRYLIEPIYYWSITEKGAPIRVDMAIIFDRRQLTMVRHTYKGREGEIKKDGFAFKYPSRKPQAVLGILKIL